MDTPPDGLTAPASPASTYRLQLQAGFGFEAAAAIAPYLAGLGVSHAYCSPYLQAARGSNHGYDVVNHWQVNDELGGADGHALFSRTLRGLGLGQVLPIDPHSYEDKDPGRLIAAANADGELLHELLERQNYRLAWWRAGRSELDYRRFFDIDTLAAIRVEDEDVFLATNGMVLRW